MSHAISGIITSFRYDGDRPNIILVGNYHFIPVKRRWEKGYQETALTPYDDFTAESRKLIRDLSFTGPCAYVETNFFGGDGEQRAEVWQDGERTDGPLLSIHGYTDDMRSEIEERHADHPVVEFAINACLKRIGIFRHDGMDEFDSARLGWYRSNDDILKECEGSSS